MIKVTVELISARTGLRSTLGTATIANNVHRTIETGGSLGDYSCVFRGKRRILWETTIAKFPRKRLLAWDLLYRCLREVIGSRNK